MSIPDFTPDEQYCIDSVKSQKGAASANGFAWTYVITGLFLFVIALSEENIVFMSSVFFAFCGIRVYEAFYYSKWIPVWKSIIEKYETAVSATDAELSRSDPIELDDNQ